MDNASSDFSAYHYSAQNEQGLGPVDSDFTGTATTLTHSFSASVSDPSPQNPRERSRSKKASSRKAKADNYASGHPCLTWRLDPDESLSDWTLTVVSNDSLDKDESEIPCSIDEPESREGDSPTASIHCYPLNPATMLPVKKYFVHRTQLAVGPRRSEYFVLLFKKKLNKDCAPKNNGTRIELRSSAAAAFPRMLDFIYSPVGTPPDVSSQSAVALRHLATCFGIRELFDSVTEFIKRDLSPETAPTYLLESSTFQHEKLMAVSLRTCAENFEAIKFSRLVTLTPELFERVVTSPDLRCTSEIASTRVASYCRCRPGAVDAPMLKRLTDAQIMPRIAPEESMFFLRLLVEIDSDEASVGGQSAASGLTFDLYNRCVKASHNIVRMAITGTKKSPGAQASSESRQHRNLVKEYRGLPSSIKVDLLEQALSQSPSPDELVALEDARKELTERYATDFSKQLQQKDAEMENLRLIYEKKLASYEAALDAQDQELRSYVKELSKFKRVPNEHRVTPLLSEYTFQQDPDFDEYGESIFGQTPPSALPKFGRQSLDGWVYRDERWKKDGRLDTQHWPMYYYKGD